MTWTIPRSPARSTRARTCSLTGAACTERSLIPFAHGVRRLGAYYNDAVQPADPFEFVGLLRGLPLISFQRNEALRELAATVRDDAALSGALRSALAAHPPGRADPGGALRVLRARPDGAAFAQRFAEVLGRFMVTVWNDVRLVDRPDLVLATVAELADARARAVGSGPDMASLERGLMDAVGPARHDEAREVLATARVSWRLRGDDNLVLEQFNRNFSHGGRNDGNRIPRRGFERDRRLRHGRGVRGGLKHEKRQERRFPPAPYSTDRLV